MGPLLVLILLFVVMYAAMIRPQQKRAREHQQLISAVQVGDEVMTTAGLYATVVDVDGEAVRFAGLGNISGWVAGPAGRRAMVSLPGIVGHQRREIREFEYRLPPGGLVVLHTDGVTDRWDLSGYPGLASHEPILVAATLLRDAGVRRDDAAVLVARALP